MSFQQTVNMTQAPAVEGDYASLNPRHYLPAAGGESGVAGWVAGSGGVVVGRFAWGDMTATDSVLVNAGSGAPNCFVAREFGEALITTYLGESGMTIPYGMPVPGAIIGGDVWAKNANASAASAIGNKAFASNTTGQVQFAAAGTTVTGYTETKWYASSIGAVGELVKLTSIALD